LRLLQYLLAIQLSHTSILGILLQLRITCANLLFARVLRDAALVERIVRSRVHVRLVQHQVVRSFLLQANLLAAREDFMPPLLLGPLGWRGRHVHLFDNVAPADARVIRAEADLAFLRRVRNNALLGAAEVVVEEVLEPHAGDKEKIPAISPALL